MKIKPIVVAIIGLVSTNVSVAENVLPSGVSINGIVQVEARFNQDYDGNDSSDFVADEVGVAIEAQVHKLVKAQIAFLYEEGATDLEIDEAFVTLGESELYLAVGQFYVPFGNFESHMISDPLTLELGDAREKAAQVGFETGGVYGSIYAFNGATQEDSEDKIDHYGANIGFAQETEGFSYDLGVSYISDIGDSDGLGAHFLFNIGPVSLIGEYVTALDGFNGKGAEPKAWNAEVGYSFEIGGKETTLALGYQGTEEMVAMELPESRILAGLSVGIYENTTFSFEYARDEDYKQSDGGTGKNADMMILQLAVEF
ncbi:MAG: LbtU family siderophore porin [Pseudomonadota bacterium]